MPRKCEVNLQLSWRGLVRVVTVVGIVGIVEVVRVEGIIRVVDVVRIKVADILAMQWTSTPYLHSQISTDK